MGGLIVLCVQSNCHKNSTLNANPTFMGFWHPKNKAIKIKYLAQECKCQDKDSNAHSADQLKSGALTA